MNPIHVLFYEEVKEKKKAANGVHGKTGMRGYVGTMRFPSDLMKGAEKRKYRKGSKCMQYNMNEIMPYNKFIQLDEHQQRVMLNNYREKFTNANIQKEWGLSIGAYYKIIKRLELPRDGFGKGNVTKDPELIGKTPEEVAEIRKERRREKDRLKQKKRTEKARQAREAQKAKEETAVSQQEVIDEAEAQRKAEVKERQREAAAKARQARVNKKAQAVEAFNEQKALIALQERITAEEPPSMNIMELYKSQPDISNLLMQLEINDTGETSHARLLRMLAFLAGDTKKYRIKIQIEEKG